MRRRLMGLITHRPSALDRVQTYPTFISLLLHCTTHHSPVFTLGSAFQSRLFVHGLLQSGKAHYHMRRRWMGLIAHHPSALDRVQTYPTSISLLLHRITRHSPVFTLGSAFQSCPFVCGLLQSGKAHYHMRRRWMGLIAHRPSALDRVQTYPTFISPLLHLITRHSPVFTLGSVLRSRLFVHGLLQSRKSPSSNAVMQVMGLIARCPSAPRSRPFFSLSSLLQTAQKNHIIKCDDVDGDSSLTVPVQSPPAVIVVTYDGHFLL